MLVFSHSLIGCCKLTRAYQWTIIDKPTDSKPTLGNTSSAQIAFTPDSAGAYQLQVKISEPLGNFIEHKIELIVVSLPHPKL